MEAQADRLQRAGATIADGLTCRADIGDLALILRARLALPQRARLATASLAALPPAARRHLAAGAIRDTAAADPLDAERERQTEMWLAHVRRSDYRSPSLTPEEQRRAAAIDLGTTTSPRARLAAAWTAAAERDRRDLVARATGRQT